MWEPARAPVLADAAYGTDTKLREGTTELGLLYVVGIQSTVTVWKPGGGPERFSGSFPVAPFVASFVYNIVVLGDY